MNPVVAQFLGYTLSVGGIVAGITQIFKMIEKSEVPILKQIVSFVDKASHTQIRVFVAVLCVILNFASEWYASGTMPVLDMDTIMRNFVSFFTATAAFTLIIKPLEAKDKEA